MRSTPTNSALIGLASWRSIDDESLEGGEPLPGKPSRLVRRLEPCNGVNKGSRLHREPVMTKLGGFLGAIVGFAVSVVFTEVIFPNHLDWQPAIANVALTVIGAYAGSELVRRLRNRRVKSSVAARRLYGSPDGQALCLAWANVRE